MKRLISILLLLSLCLALFAGCKKNNNNSNNNNNDNDNSNVTDNTPTSEGLTYRLSTDGTYYEVVNLHNCSNAHILIPSAYQGLPVKSIVVDNSEEDNYWSIIQMYALLFSVNINSDDANTTVLSVTIPESITYIDPLAFPQLAKLKNIIVSNNNLEYKSIDGNLYSKDEKTLLHYSSGKSEYSFEIPEGVTNIGEYALCSPALKSVTIPKSIVSIHEWAFSTCAAAEIINNSNAVVKAGLLVHNGTTKIESLNDYRFLNYYGVYYLVAYTGNDTELNLPLDYKGNEYSIYPYAFLNSDSNITKINIPKGCVEINDKAFAGCDSLANITVADGHDEYISLGGNVYSKSGQMLLFNAPAITDLVIPNHVTKISSSVYFPNLETIKIGNGITELSYMFNACPRLKSVTLGSGVSSIAYSFLDCENLTSITVDEGNPNIKVIDNVVYSKDGQTLLWVLPTKTDLVIPDSVASIDNYAFVMCSNLQTLAIGSGLNDFNFDLFSSIPLSLTNITVSADNPYYKSVNNVVYSKDGSELVFCAPCNTDVIIPEEVTDIGDYAFYCCENLKSITIPDSVTNIGDYAFEGCNNLESITIGSGVYQIGSRVFPTYNEYSHDHDHENNSDEEYVYKLKNVTVSENNPYYKSVDNVIYSKDGESLIWCSPKKTELVIPYGVTSIGDYAFYNCSALTSISIPDSVTSIGYYAFYNCAKLTSVSIPDSVTIIGRYAFSYCSALTSVVIGSGWNTIDISVFSSCDELSSITISSDNPDYQSIDNAIYSKSGESLIWCPPGKTELVIADGVTIVERSALNGCTELTNVTLPDSLTTIDGNIFAKSGSNKLTNLTIGSGLEIISRDMIDAFTNVTISNDNPYYRAVDNVIYSKDGTVLVYSANDKETFVIPNGVTSIGDRAFYNCSELVSITIPDSVTSIGDNAFYNCSKLVSITISDSVTYIGNYAFHNCMQLKSVTIGSGLEIINPYAFQLCISLENITVSTDNPHYKSVDNVIYSKDGKTLVFCARTKTEFSIPDGVTSIASYAFAECLALVNVAIPSSVTRIDSYAFSNCYSLTSIAIPAGVTSISDGAFSGCSMLASITIPDRVTIIGSSAFSGCSSLTSITIPEGVTSIGSSAFWNCSKLTSVNIPKSVTTIGDNAFYYCHKLKSVTIPDNVTHIGNNAFANCARLTSVVIGSGVVSMSSDVFSECYRLSNITISANNANYKSVDNVIYTKDGKTLLFCALDKTHVDILDGVTTIAANAFRKCYRLNSLVIPDSVTTIEVGAFGNGNSYYITNIQYVTVASVEIYSYSLYLNNGKVIDDYSNKLYNVEFENPNGWKVKSNSGFGGGIIISPNGSISYPSNETELSSEALSDPKTAADYLKNVYTGYTWTRS